MTKHGAGAGHSLPTVFARLEDIGAKFYSGQLSMVVAAPGGGKSIFAEWWGLHVDVPGLYLSADTDSFTMTTRAIAMVTGDVQTKIREELKAEGPGRDFYLDEVEALRATVQFSFDTAPKPEDVEAEVYAFAMVYGNWPRWIVVDNLLNFQQGAGDWESLLETLLHLKELAGVTNAHVMVLHHVGGNWTDSPVPPPRSAIFGKVDQLPAMILSIGRDIDKWVIAVLKNRNAPADPKGQRIQVTYHVDLDSMQVGEPPMQSLYDQFGEH